MPHSLVDRERDLEAPIKDDLGTKMVFLAGPRQVGKTPLAKHVLSRWRSGAYLSWDNREDVRDLEPLRDLASVQLLADMLPDRRTYSAV